MSETYSSINRLSSLSNFNFEGDLYVTFDSNNIYIKFIFAYYAIFHKLLQQL